MHGIDDIVCSSDEFSICRIQLVVIHADFSFFSEGVTHEIPASEISTCRIRKFNFTISIIRHTRKRKAIGILRSSLLGIEIALARDKVEGTSFVVDPFFTFAVANLVEIVEVKVAGGHTSGGRIHFDRRSDEVVTCLAVVIGVTVDGKGVIDRSLI